MFIYGLPQESHSVVCVDKQSADLAAHTFHHFSSTTLYFLFLIQFCYFLLNRREAGLWSSAV